MSLFFLKRGLAYYFIIITICNDRHKEVARTRMAPRIFFFFGIRLGLGWEGEWAHSETKKNGVLRVWAEQRRFWVTEIPLLANASSDTYLTSRVSC